MIINPSNPTLQLSIINYKGPALPVENKKVGKKVENKIWIAFVALRLPMKSTKKIQPIRSSRLAGQREHIYKCLVLFYIED